MLLVTFVTFVTFVTYAYLSYFMIFMIHFHSATPPSLSLSTLKIKGTGSDTDPTRTDFET